jgi:hypothetical protein
MSVYLLGGNAMQNRITDIAERQDRSNNEPQPVGVILEELFALYERQFPNIHIKVVETTTTAA